MKEAQLRDTQTALSVAMAREAQIEAKIFQIAASMGQHVHAIERFHEKSGFTMSGSIGVRRFLCAFPAVIQLALDSGEVKGARRMNDMEEGSDGMKETCEGQGEEEPTMRTARREVRRDEELVVAASTKPRRFLCATPAMTEEKEEKVEAEAEKAEREVEEGEEEDTTKISKVKNQLAESVADVRQARSKNCDSARFSSAAKPVLTIRKCRRRQSLPSLSRTPTFASFLRVQVVVVFMFDLT